MSHERLLVAGCLLLVAGCWLLGCLLLPATSHQQPVTSNASVKLRQILWLPLGQRAVDLETRIRPSANPIAVVQIRLDRRAVSCMSFVIASTRAERPRPTGRAVCFIGDVVLL